MLRERYPFLEFADSGPADGPGAQLAQIREQIHGRFWLHLGQGWRFFAPEDFITRLIGVLDAETQVSQVGINFADAVKLTGASAAEQVVRRAPDAGRYVLTDVVASGPAMFDTARLDRAGGIHGTDPDPIAELGRRATATGLQTASLDEVLCIATVAASDTELAVRETAAFIAEHLPGVPAFGHPHDTLRFALRQISGPGLALEFGVWRGTTLRIIADALSDEHDVVGFDCFTGLPEAWRPGFPAGLFTQDELPVVPGARLVVGEFETTLPGFLEENRGRIAFVHLDADLYSSTSTVLRLLGDRLGPGTVLVFDEFFHYPGWQHHEYRAWCEFIAERDPGFDYLGYTADNEQLVIRLR